MKYIPLQTKSHYSLLRGLSKPINVLKHLNKNDIKSAAITDYGTISGCVNFFKTLKEGEKPDIPGGVKPILGITLYITQLEDSTIHDELNRNHSYLTILAKNLEGWKELIKIVSYSNDPKRIYNKIPRLSLTELASFDTKNLICTTGGVASVLSNAIFMDWNMAYGTSVKSAAEGYLLPDWKKLVEKKIGQLKDMFGADLYLEAQLNDQDTTAAQLVLRECWDQFDIKKVAAINSHYLEPQDSLDHRLLLCSHLKCAMREVNKIACNADEFTYGSFFLSDKYDLPKELDNRYTDDEIKATFEINDKCESYNILNKPTLPKFNCPNNLTEDEYLREICRLGWQKKIAGRIKKEGHPEYADRIKRELEVLQGAGLSPYFLILKDITDFVKNKGWLLGPARGSAGGCLTSYLTGITAIDPMLYNLIFERFYNAGRNTKDRVAMPDIDIDVPATKREEVIDYIKDKYGHENVYQMITYTNLKGRSALKEVLRIYGGITYDVMNAITESIPDEAKIADDLQEMKEEEGESSIIGWALENKADALKEWCHIDEQGELRGPLAKRFEQAIRLEGIHKAQSKHAAGIVISPFPLKDMCPLVYDEKTEGQVAGLEMNDMEAIGLVKMDILGISTLDRIMGVQKILRGEEYYE